MKELTDDELNIAICEWLGWTNIKQDQIGWWGYPPNDNPCRYCPLPNHITGLEALGNMQLAFKNWECSDDEEDAYHEALIREVIGRAACCPTDYYRAFNATARQHAIALLDVIKPELFV